MQIGFIGLGAMGTAMAQNLLTAGHAVRIWNRSPEPAENLAAAGAHVVSKPGEAAQGDAVVTMLANDEAVRSVCLDGGLIDAMAPRTVHVGCSTISVALAQELTAAHATRGLSYVAAPVFGRPDAAKARLLHIVVAGPAEAVEAMRPVFAALGQKVWPVGEDPSLANVVKLGGNLMIAAAIEAMAEAAALGQAHGLAPATMLDVYTNTMFACRAYQSYAGNIAQNHYEPAGFKLSLGLKDVNLALAAAQAAAVPLPLGELIAEAMQDAIAAGDGAKDWSAIGARSLRRVGRS
jgi:3-hydroxyisobutyrate dehydrogenase-like beta-hydroxyacid dehydrogenase